MAPIALPRATPPESEPSCRCAVRGDRGVTAGWLSSAGVARLQHAVAQRAPRVKVKALKLSKADWLDRVELPLHFCRHSMELWISISCYRNGRQEGGLDRIKSWVARRQRDRLEDEQRAAPTY